MFHAMAKEDYIRFSTCDNGILTEYIDWEEMKMYSYYTQRHNTLMLRLNWFAIVASFILVYNCLIAQIFQTRKTENDIGILGV